MNTFSYSSHCFPIADVIQGSSSLDSQLAVLGPGEGEMDEPTKSLLSLLKNLDFLQFC